MTDIINSIVGFLTTHQVEIGTSMGVLFAIAKAFSNENAGLIVSSIQKVVDLVANVVVGVGSILKMVSDFLGALIKSDGIAGKK